MPLWARISEPAYGRDGTSTSLGWEVSAAALLLLVAVVVAAWTGQPAAEAASEAEAAEAAWGQVDLDRRGGEPVLLRPSIVQAKNADDEDERWAARDEREPIHVPPRAVRTAGRRALLATEESIAKLEAKKKWQEGFTQRYEYIPTIPIPHTE